MKVTHAFLLVEDYDRAKDFYTRVLGFEVTTDYSADGHRWLELAHPSGGAALVLDQVAPQHREYLAQRRRTGAPSYSFTLDSAAEFEQIRRRGVTVVSEPQQLEYGGTDACIDDTCGNIICLHFPD